MLQVRTGDEAELKVAFQVVYRIPVKGQLLQLRCIFQTADVIEFFDAVVRQEDPLQAGTVLESVHRLNQVSPQVQLSKRDQTVQVLYSSDKVIGEI